ncbi:MAG: lipoyl synthase [bacterium]
MVSKPVWLRKKITGETLEALNVEDALSKNLLHTVCQEAQCPNISECFNQGTATFLILGKICTRNCRFCAIEKGRPSPVDVDEPKRVANAVKALNLRYVVVTSVTRDDLIKGGAEQFRDTILEIKKTSSDVKIEVLIPDFKGDRGALNIVLDAHPDVLNHNVETVPSLYPTVRPIADFDRSIEILYWTKERHSSIITKSGIMVGLGEKEEELFSVFKRLAGVGCDILTIGQYLQPSKKHLPVVEYVRPERFKEFESMAYEAGIKYVIAGPFVRSSYLAQKGYEKISEVKDR